MKKLIPNLLSLIFIFAIQIGHGQANMEDVVYLKNGNIIRGIIIEQIPNQSLKIQTVDRNVFVFKIEEVEKMTKENIPGTSLRETQRKKKGYINISEINFSPGITGAKINDDIKVKNEDISFGFKTVNGYQVSEHFSIGLGLGIDRYKEATLIPITLDLRFPVLKAKMSPVFIFGVGRSSGLNDVKGGFTTNFGFGIRSYMSDNSAFIFNFGYKLQSTEVKYTDYKNYVPYFDQYGYPIYGYPEVIIKQVLFCFLSVNIGFSF